MRRLLRLRDKNLFFSADGSLTESLEQGKEFANWQEARNFARQFELKQPVEFYYSFADEACSDFDFAVIFEGASTPMVVSANAVETHSG